VGPAVAAFVGAVVAVGAAQEVSSVAKATRTIRTSVRVRFMDFLLRIPMTIPATRDRKVQEPIVIPDRSG
jgi:hypothetical protein